MFFPPHFPSVLQLDVLAIGLYVLLLHGGHAKQLMSKMILL